MSQPFTIWTMRRTGGTTLTNLLMSTSEYPEIEHEPFNGDRIFGPLSAGWYEHKDIGRTKTDLTQALKDRPLIKHCFEIHGSAFNRVLIRAFERFGYRQIVLRREDEVARILSLELAKITGVWGKMGSERGYAKFQEMEESKRMFDIPAAQAHLEECFQRWDWLDAEFDVMGTKPLELRFEDLYGDVENGKRVVRSLFDSLGFPSETGGERDEAVENALVHKGQNSKSMMSLVCNFDEARTTLQARLDVLRMARAR